MSIPSSRQHEWGPAPVNRVLSSHGLYLTHLGFFVVVVVVFCFSRQGFLCSPGYPGTHSIDQAGLKLRDPPASAGIKSVCHHCPASPKSVFGGICVFVKEQMPQHMHRGQFSSSCMRILGINLR